MLRGIQMIAPVMIKKARKCIGLYEWDAASHLVVQEWLNKRLSSASSTAGFPLVRAHGVKGVHSASAYHCGPMMMKFAKIPVIK